MENGQVTSRGINTVHANGECETFISSRQCSYTLALDISIGGSDNQLSNRTAGNCETDLFSKTLAQCYFWIFFCFDISDAFNLEPADSIVTQEEKKAVLFIAN